MDRRAGRGTDRFFKLGKEPELTLERGGTVQRVEFTRIYLFIWMEAYIAFAGTASHEINPH